MLNNLLLIVKCFFLFSGKHRAHARQKGAKKGKDPKRVLEEAERASEREKRRNEKKGKK